MKDLLNVRFESAGLPGASVEVYELAGREHLSQLFEFELRLVSASDAPLDEDALLTGAAELVFERGGQEVRRIYGVCSAIKDTLDSQTQHRIYILTWQPLPSRERRHGKGSSCGSRS